MIPNTTAAINQTRRFGLFSILLGGIFFWLAFYFSQDTMSALRFSKLGTVRLPTQLFFFSGSCACVLSGLICHFYASRFKRLYTITISMDGLVILLLIIVWMGSIRRTDVVGLATQSIRLATPIGLGALAGILCERSGVVNIAIEGMMLFAACVGIIIALYAQNIWVGLGSAILAGGVMAFLHAILSVRLMVDQIVSGTVVNILAIGITGVMRRSILVNNSHDPVGVLPSLSLPFLSDIPIIGKIFFRQQPMVYAMLILVAVVHITLFYTRWGLRTRAVGEHPRAADALGLNVFRIRYINIVAAGMIAGLGGAWFSLETVGNFQEIMTGGKGFIALAAMIFGKWSPIGAFGAAMLFGFADALQIKLQVLGVNMPYQFLGMVPYIITMVVLAGVVGKAIAPAADGIPYDRENF